jgi:tRNA-2-methylthio-N6-dimethylallyladenosine synthase
LRAEVVNAKRLYLETFGCQMNEHDSEKIAAVLARRDYRLTSDPEQADLILLNTCAIREKAEQKYRSTLGRFRAIKERRPDLIIGVGGCAAQQSGDRILREIPHVDVVFGTQALLRLPALLDQVREERRAADLDFTTRLTDRFDSSLIPQSRHPARAYVTVMEGCDLFCSFCVVPYARGREISRPADQILTEVRVLAERGVKEITLLGQTVNAYGRRRGQVTFAALLAAIDRVPGIARIRFTSSHPIYMTEGLIETYERLEHLCPHLHLPVQSGSDRILGLMRRRYDRAGYCDIVRRLREVRPDVALTSDIIVGFPGETVVDFEETLSLMREIRFSDLYAFAYSERSGTKASTLTGWIPEPLRRERLARVLELQRKIGLEENRSRIGAIDKVLVEGRSRTDPAKLTGRTGHNKVVNFAGDPALAGSIAAVQIIDASSSSLLGKPLA